MVVSPKTFYKIPMNTENTHTAPAGESHAFQAEMQQLLSILVHSLYSEREIFLREIISNAADALSKVRFAASANQPVRSDDLALEIRLEVDKENKTLTLTDTGIGMSREELQNHLGTIARSGTKAFAEQLKNSNPEEREQLIGQFGVGFYSVFMVADQVIVDSLAADPSAAAARWSSSGDGNYTLADSEHTTRGTRMTLHLKEDAAEFLEDMRLEHIVKKYSNYVPFPVLLGENQLNSKEAIWAMPAAKVTEEQHQSFYQQLVHDHRAPLHHMHLSIDAPVQYKALFYIPPHLTNEVLYSPTGFGVALYANRIMIQPETPHLLPLYLRFIRGVVDSEDIQLNVSREMVQQSPVVAKLKQSLTGRVLRGLKEMAEKSPETYQTFWDVYGRVLKEGIPGDNENRDRLVELLRYTSSTESGLTSFNAYVERMPEGQDAIYYVTGASPAAIARNPNLEYFRKKGWEVLYMTDQVDDFVVAHLTEYNEKKLVPVDQAELDGLESEESTETHSDHLAGEPLEQLVAMMKETLGERVKDVGVSKRLVNSPASLVNPDGNMTNIQNMMRMMGQEVPDAPRILQINPGHSLIKHMGQLQQSGDQPELLKLLADHLLETCRMVEGTVEKPEELAERMQQLMETSARLAVEKA